LPVLNAEAVRQACQFGLAVGAKIGERSIFARKNYFYPDLPKGYQISQFELPIVGVGSLDITVQGQQKTVGITRAHLEEDAGKSLHDAFGDNTGIDLNRAGTPLLEIVSEPDMRSAKEAIAYMKKIHALVTYLGISDGNMQEGSFRCDANISIRPQGQETLGTRTELKNLNSFRFIEKAIHYEVERQIDIIESGGSITQETRLYDANKNETRSMRSKEEANDYRYFPDPDLLPVVIEPEFLAQLKAGLPELPDQRCVRFSSDYALSDEDAQSLTSTRPLADFYEAVVKHCDDARLSANWVLSELGGALNKASLDLADSPINATQLGGLIARIKDNTISGKIAKQVFAAMWAGEGDADSIIEAKGLKQVTDTSAIEAMVDKVIADNPGQVEQYRAGKTKVMGFFVGQIMKASKGKANPAAVNQLLKQKLKPNL